MKKIVWTLLFAFCFTTAVQAYPYRPGAWCYHHPNACHRSFHSWCSTHPYRCHHWNYRHWHRWHYRHFYHWHTHRYWHYHWHWHRR